MTSSSLLGSEISCAPARRYFLFFFFAFINFFFKFEYSKNQLFLAYSSLSFDRVV